MWVILADIAVLVFTRYYIDDFKTARLVYSFFGVFIFSIWLVYDVQKVIGSGKYRYDSDDYIIAAVNIYLDVIILFLDILRILGASKN